MKLRYTKKSRDKEFTTLVAAEPTRSIVIRNIAATLIFGTLFVVLMYFNDSLSLMNILSLTGILIIYLSVMIGIDVLIRRRFKKR